jgi:hypothetical protein
MDNFLRSRIDSFQTLKKQRIQYFGVGDSLEDGLGCLEIVSFAVINAMKANFDNCFVKDFTRIRPLLQICLYLITS